MKKKTSLKAHIYRGIILSAALLLLPSVLTAQKKDNGPMVEITGAVEDAFLKKPLDGVKISILDADSTVLIDSAETIRLLGSGDRLVRMMFGAKVKAGKHDYIVRAMKPGYGDAYQPVSVPSEQTTEVGVPVIRMRKERKVTLGEVVVKATKVKMYYKGDTIVYNADAFLLPDGSMLDDLIRQMPGVTMNDRGEIFVNGRKVDELLLGSRSFMRGNKQVLMENLPYYTVKNIKVYEKQTGRSEALGYDIEPRRYVMDVNLKDEYHNGYIANVEGAAGSHSRWLGRGFLLGFTDRLRYSLKANLNNVNESRHIGKSGHWTPATMPQSLLTTRSVSTDIDYESEDKKIADSFYADYTSSTTTTESRVSYQQFLDGGNPTSLTESADNAGNRHLFFRNELELKKHAYTRFATSFVYDKNKNYGQSAFSQWNDSLTALMRTVTMSEERQWELNQVVSGSFNINKKKHYPISYYLEFRHRDNKSQPSSRYDTWQAATQADVIRRNVSDVANKMTNLHMIAYWALTDLFGKTSLHIDEQLSYYNTRAHDWLYHPDTLMTASQLDMMKAITDPANSYDSHQRQWCNTLSFKLIKPAYYKIGFVNIQYERWRVDLKMPLYRQALDYKRGIIDTTAHNTQLFFNPSVSYRTISADGKRDFSMSAMYEANTPDLLNRIGWRDDSQPLIVREGNPSLKGRATADVNIDYSHNNGKKIKQWHVGTALDYSHRDVAQSAVYDAQTGVYTYKPVNISGAYTATAKFDISSDIGKNSYWSWQINADAAYNHSIDQAMLAGETRSHENKVNTLTLHDNAYIQYNKGMLNIRATGDIRWRHSEGKMRDFGTLNATDFRYGLSARYTLPLLKTTLSADGNMYSRRGYGSSELNTDDFVVNASVSQPFLKGKLIARIEAFDLLHQISSTQYAVDAQGRKETWSRSLPNYVMLHLVYHFNRNPKSR